MDLVLGRNDSSNYFFHGLIVFAVAFFILPTELPAKSDTDGFIYQAGINSSINPVTADYFKRALDKAENDNAHALILQLDTPGGLMDSMNKITSAILNADVPVIVWIGPAGARAASAGVFITYASHLAAMSDGTRIGAAHPVKGGQGGEMNETMEAKVVNDAVAQLQSYAKKRGRNRALADSFVRKSVSLTGEEALENQVVEYRSNNIPDLLQQIDGEAVAVNGDTVTLNGSSSVRELPQNWKEDFLNTLVNPNLVYILLMLGMYGLIYEFSNPGVGIGGVVGGISLLLSMYGLSLLPLNYAGLGLISLGMALMILDIFVPSFGVLTMGGMASFFLGSVMLFETEAFSVSLGLIIGITLTTALFLLVVGYLILGSFNLSSPIGEDSMIGRRGTVKDSLDPDGMVYVHGEYWKATSKDEEQIPEGTEIEVLEKKPNRRLLVSKPDPSDENTG